MLLNTPPMGWNTWNTFGENISEQLIIETVDAMVEKGLRDAGYIYVVIDDCWSLKERDENGRLVADPAKFPHGLKHLADYVHSKGMKLGIYGCCGPKTCMAYPGSLDHELEDALFFAENEIDYLKYDYCYHPRTLESWTLYNRMRMALNATGRDIVFSLCSWGQDGTFDWARSVGGDLYRSTGDICDSFDSIKDIFASQWKNYALSGPSCFNDIDMMVVGMNGKGNVGVENGCTPEEYATHFKWWCMVGAPLMLGCDIRTMSDETLKLVTNKELIAINQDPEVRPPIFTNISAEDPGYEMVKHVSNNEYVFSLTNKWDDYNGHTRIYLSDIGFSCRDGYAFKLRDVMTGEELGLFNDIVKVKELAPHATCILRGPLVKVN